VPLCVLCVSVVENGRNTTTEKQRTRRGHRESALGETLYRVSSYPAISDQQSKRGTSLNKKRGRIFTAWCLMAFVVVGGYSAMGPAFASCRLAQSSMIKLSRKPSAKTLKSSVMVEEFSFLIKDFKAELQGENQNLNITMQFRYRVNISDSEYPDFRSVAKDIELFLTNYPNQKDYWEIINKKITLLVLDKYPPISKVTCQLQVSPSTLAPYLRSSTVTRERRSIRGRSVPTRRVK
jgi:hypothetical protein